MCIRDRNYAIDKDAYIQLMYSGYGKPATSVVPSIIGGYEEQEAYTYDVDLSLIHIFCMVLWKIIERHRITHMILQRVKKYRTACRVRQFRKLSLIHIFSPENMTVRMLSLS